MGNEVCLRSNFVVWELFVTQVLAISVCAKYTLGEYSFYDKPSLIKGRQIISCV